MYENLQCDPEEIKIDAVRKVLKSLGEGVYALLNNYLMDVHGISLDANEGGGSCSLAQLREVLDNFIGEQSAGIILELVFIQMEELTEAAGAKGH